MYITSSLVVEVVAAIFTALGSIGTIIGLRKKAQSNPTQLLPLPESKSSIGKQVKTVPLYETVSASLHELPAFRKLLVDEFGEAEVAPLDLFAKWQKRNPNVCQLVYKTNPSNGARVLAGGVKLVPIDNQLIFDIEYGDFRAGNAIPENHILKPGTLADGWWIGDLLSVAGSNRAVVAALRKFFVENLRLNMRLYARPLTQEGLELLISFGFVTVGDFKIPQIGRVCGLYPEDVNKLLARLQAGKGLRVPRRRAKKATVNSAQVAVPTLVMEPELVTA
ncbi:MAG TPA: hypothetical protein VGH51_08505 [Candidatus Angelobacter sp.]|jgi:hypothetical protein